MYTITLLYIPQHSTLLLLIKTGARQKTYQKIRTPVIITTDNVRPLDKRVVIGRHNQSSPSLKERGTDPP